MSKHLIKLKTQTTGAVINQAMTFAEVLNQTST